MRTVFPAPILIKIHEHIDLFPNCISHYRSTPVTYLNAQLNVAKVHKLFIEKFPKLKNIVKYVSFTWSISRKILVMHSADHRLMFVDL